MPLRNLASLRVDLIMHDNSEIIKANIHMALTINKSEEQENAVSSGHQKWLQGQLKILLGGGKQQKHCMAKE